jgi:hypothetical protein
MAKVEDKMIRVWLKDFEALRKIKEQMIVEQRRAVSDAEVFERIISNYENSNINTSASGFNLDSFK